MKIKTVIYLLACIFCTVNCRAQQVLSASGNFYSGEPLKISWTVGETIISSLDNETNILTQGMHQSKLTITAMEEIELSDLQISVYPNPVSECINLKIYLPPGLVKHNDFQNHSYRLFDLNGKLLLHKKIENIGTIIHMGKYSPSTYFLVITENNIEIKKYKIIKQ